MRQDGTGRSLGVRSEDGRDVVTMVDWDSDTWGGTVHLAENGSWVPDKHSRDDRTADDPA